MRSWSNPYRLPAVFGEKSMKATIVRRLLLFSTYFFCAKPYLDWLDMILKQSVLWFICRDFKESTVVGFALLEDRILGYRLAGLG
jgi:hypothetical protein